MKHAAHLHTVIVVSYARKSKNLGRYWPNTYKEITLSLYYIRKNPNCRPYSSPHQVPKHKMLWYIEEGTLREVGKIDA